jgi:hypothetical protein
LVYFLKRESYVLVISKNELGDILGDFFTNASGHPGARELFSTNKQTNGQTRLSTREDSKKPSDYKWLAVSVGSLTRRQGFNFYYKSDTLVEKNGAAPIWAAAATGI